MEQLIIKIDWQYFLGLVGTLILLAWLANGRFTKIEMILQQLKERIDKIERKI